VTAIALFPRGPRVKSRRPPWNNPRICPMCGKRATDIVGARRYSADCARTLRFFVGLREVAPAPLVLQVRP